MLLLLIILIYGHRAINTFIIKSFLSFVQVDNLTSIYIIYPFTLN